MHEVCRESVRTGRGLCEHYQRIQSRTSSIILVTAADLRPTHDGNEILKYADESYLIIPAANTRTCPEELMHIEARAATNNIVVALLYISGKYFIVENGEGINQWQYSITIARRHSSDGGGYILPTCRILSPNRAVLFQLWFFSFYFYFS